MRIRTLIFISIVSFFITLILNGIFTGGTIFGFFFFFVFDWVALFVILRYLYFSKSYGQYRLSEFALNCEGLGGWKIDDPYAIEAPGQLSTKPITIKKFDKYTGEILGEETIELNFRKIFKELNEQHVDSVLPKNEIEFKGMIGNPLMYVQKDLENLKQRIEKKYNLTTEEKKGFEKVIEESVMDFDFSKVRSLIKAFFVYLLSVDAEPKIYSIVSASNNLVIYWFGNSQPAEYGIYRTKQFFWKWKSVPVFKGMPVVEAFGVKLDGRVVLGKEDEDDFEAVLCLPTFDESYRKYRSLLLAKYEIIAKSLASLAQKFNSALPYLDFVSLLEADRDRALAEKEVLKKGVFTAYSDVASVSELFMETLSTVSKSIGAVSALPNLPKETKEAVARITSVTEEGKSKIEAIKSKMSKALEEFKPAEEKKSEEVKSETEVESK